MVLCLYEHFMGNDFWEQSYFQHKNTLDVWNLNYYFVPWNPPRTFTRKSGFRGLQQSVWESSVGSAGSGLSFSLLHLWIPQGAMKTVARLSLPILEVPGPFSAGFVHGRHANRHFQSFHSVPAVQCTWCWRWRKTGAERRCREDANVCTQLQWRPRKAVIL